MGTSGAAGLRGTADRAPSQGPGRLALGRMAEQKDAGGGATAEEPDGGPRAPDLYQAKYMGRRRALPRQDPRAARVPPAPPHAPPGLRGDDGPGPRAGRGTPRHEPRSSCCLWALFSVLRISVSRDEVYVQYGLFGPRIAVRDIERCEAVDYDWKKYGGWGIRYGARRERRLQHARRRRPGGEDRPPQGRRRARRCWWPRPIRSGSRRPSRRRGPRRRGARGGCASRPRAPTMRLRQAAAEDEAAEGEDAAGEKRRADPRQGGGVHPRASSGSRFFRRNAWRKARCSACWSVPCMRRHEHARHDHHEHAGDDQRHQRGQRGQRHAPGEDDHGAVAEGVRGRARARRARRRTRRAAPRPPVAMTATRKELR